MPDSFLDFSPLDIGNPPRIGKRPDELNWKKTAPLQNDIRLPRRFESKPCQTCEMPIYLRYRTPRAIERWEHQKTCSPACHQARLELAREERELDTKTCTRCGKTYTRRVWETKSLWGRRATCGGNGCRSGPVSRTSPEERSHRQRDYMRAKRAEEKRQRHE